MILTPRRARHLHKGVRPAARLQPNWPARDLCPNPETEAAKRQYGRCMLLHAEMLMHRSVKASIPRRQQRMIGRHNPFVHGIV